MKPPFEPYEGTDKYTFVCFDRKDTYLAYPVMSALRADGVRLWFHPAKNNLAENYIEEHIKNCGVFLLFLTGHSVKGRQCRKELKLAAESGKKVISVRVGNPHIPKDLKKLIPQNTILRIRHFASCKELSMVLSPVLIRFTGLGERYGFVNKKIKIRRINPVLKWIFIVLILLAAALYFTHKYGILSLYLPELDIMLTDLSQQLPEVPLE